MKVAVTGGAGYIGSFAAAALIEGGHEVGVIDSLELGHRAAIPEGADFFEARISDTRALREILEQGRFDSIMHFAAYSQIPESVADPAKYYLNNVGGTASLLTAARETGVHNFIFSSTAATYGNPKGDLTEDHPTTPINPYGKTKLIVEELLRDEVAAGSFLRATALRYFNAAGAKSDGTRGEDHNPETHLIPNVIKAGLGQGPALKVFGNDYGTPDGTCVRDYVHVEDLARAHVLALEALQARKDGSFDVMNVGTGKGASVLEVITVAGQALGAPVPYEIHGRRVGDPSILVADSGKLQKMLGWIPQFTTIREIIDTVVAWAKKHPNGYEDR